MSFNITHAQYSNTDRSAAVITTDEAGAVLITQADAELWTAMLAAGTPVDVVVPSTAPAVPASVSQRQARLALLQVGKLDAVGTAIGAMPEPQRSAAQIEWDYAVTVERNSPLVATLATALSLSDADIDALFITAGGL